MCTVAAASGAASVRVWQITSGDWRPREALQRANVAYAPCDLLSETVQRTAARPVRDVNPKRRADDRPGSDRATTVGGKARAGHLMEEPGVAPRKSQRDLSPGIRALPRKPRRAVPTHFDGGTLVGVCPRVRHLTAFRVVPDNPLGRTVSEHPL